MIPILFRIGPITVYSYGLMMALGFLAADLFASLEFKRRGYDPEHASMLVLWVAICGIAGSRIYDILDNLQRYLADPWSMIFSGSGFVYFGGLLGGLIASFFFSRRHKIPWLIMGDMCAPALIIGHAVGRLGCQLSGDGDWGLPSTLPWAMAFPKAIVGWNAQTVLKLDSHGNLVSGFFPGVRVHPTPVYESILYTAVFLILWSLRKKPFIEQSQGRLFYLYLMLAGASRFLVEFIRINPRIFLGLSEAQLISAAMMIVGIMAYCLTGAKQPMLSAQRPVQA